MPVMRAGSRGVQAHSQNVLLKNAGYAEPFPES